MKKIILILIALFSLNQISFAKTEPLINSFSSHKIPFEIKVRSNYYKYFRIIFTTGYLEAVKISSNSFLTTEKKYKDSLSFYKSNVFEIFYSHDSVSWKKSANYFDLTGNEKEIKIEVDYFGFEEKVYCQIEVYRFYSAPEEIKIVSAWDQKIGSEPSFKLINNSPFTFYSSFNEFWGSTYKLENNEWALESIGGICGTRGDGPPFKQGDTIISTGADFIGEDYAVQQKGKYKYIVKMSTADVFSFGRSIRPDNPDKNIYDIYYLEKEFEITSDSVHYPRSTYEKREIRGIYNLMQKLVQKIILSTPATIKKSD